MKKRYFAIPILAIALHFFLSNLLYFLVERLVLDVFHISPQQFMKYSYWGEILIYAVLILVFFTLYKLLWRKEISPDDGGEQIVLDRSYGIRTIVDYG